MLKYYYAKPNYCKYRKLITEGGAGMRPFAKVLRLLSAIIWITCLFPVMAQAESLANREVPPTLTVQMDGAGRGVTEMGLKLHPGERLRVELTSAAGTGYEWQLAAKPDYLQVVAMLGPEPVSPDKMLCGGPQRRSYVLQAGDSLGTETIRFILACPWIDKGQAVKTLAITIDVR